MDYSHYRLKTQIQFFCLICIYLVLSGCTNVSHTHNKTHFNETLRIHIMEMYKKAEQYREKCIASKPSSEAQKEVWGALMEADRQNEIEMKKIIEQWGWPSPDMIGKEGVSAAFLIVQHSNLALQKYAFPFIEKAYDACEIHGEALALLTDRILVREGKKQIYGTQSKIINGKITLDPIENEAEVEARRQAIGLPPLAEYLSLLNKVYLTQNQ